MLRSKNLMKVLSVLIAITLWGYVIWDTNPTITKSVADVPVQLLSVSGLESRGLAILGEKDFTVDIKIQGKKKDISNMDLSDIGVIADIGGYGKGENSIAVSVQPLNNASIVEVKPRRITVNLDELAYTEKDVKIVVEGEFAENTEVGNLSVSPSAIVVKGAKTLVDSISYLEALVDVSSIKERETVQDIVLVPKNEGEEEVTDVSLRQKTSQVTSMLYYTKTVPLVITQVGQPAEGFEIIQMDASETVTVRGSSSALAEISEITGEVQTEGISETQRLRARLLLPEGITLSRGLTEAFVLITVEAAEEETNEEDIPQEE